MAGESLSLNLAWRIACGSTGARSSLAESNGSNVHLALLGDWNCSAEQLRQLTEAVSWPVKPGRCRQTWQNPPKMMKKNVKHMGRFFFAFFMDLVQKGHVGGDTMGIECVGETVIDPTWLVVWNMNFIFPYSGNNNPN